VRAVSLVGDMRAVAQSYFESVSPAHDWHHVQRVEALAERLLAEHEGDADPETVRLAVLLHDIGRSREDRGVVDDHAEWGAREARRLLEKRSVDPERVDAVCHAVRVHRYSNDHEPGSPEAKLVCDADNLDALGAVGLARCFTYGGERGEVIHDPDRPPTDDDTAEGATQYNHVHKKLLDLPDRMYTDAGRRIAADRAAFLRAFVARFDREVRGER
jgi:uncharacterized protein